MKPSKSIATRIIIVIVACVFFALSGIFFSNYVYTRKLLIKNIESNARNLSMATTNKIESVLRPIEKVPINIATTLEYIDFKDSSIFVLLETLLEKNAEISSITVAYEPYCFKDEIERLAPSFFRRGSGLDYTYLRGEYFYEEWYQIPKMLERTVWSEPYYEERAGGSIVATCSTPFYRVSEGKRHMAGIVKADISLEWLQRLVSSIGIGSKGYGFLVGKDGTFITHPDKRLIMNESIFSLAEERGDRVLREIGRRMVNYETGYESIKEMTTQKDSWLAFAPLFTSGWSLGVIFPKDELMVDLVKLNSIVLVLAVTGLAVVVIMIILIAESMTSPLRSLSRATENIAKGDLDTPIPEVKSQDEIGVLTNAFKEMQESLKKYIKELTEAIAAKERIESELKIAHDIQMGILPRDFPPFPDREEIEIHAFLEPAREMGGDFYDFFFVDSHRLCIAIGDVSGKGVPAALFMSVTKSLLKAKASQELGSSAILSRLNQDLSINNPSLMFVTVFIGILDVRTGEFVYSNGGHNPPFVIYSNGDVKLLPVTRNIALGVMEEAVYDSQLLLLRPGEKIFLYTDGVTEAMNSKEELFSEERVKEGLLDLTRSSPQDVISGMLERLRVFGEGAPQWDDITMVCLHFKGHEKGLT